jgi:MFS family permease
VVFAFYRGTATTTPTVPVHALKSTQATTFDRSAFRTPIVYAFALLVGLVGMGQFSATFFVPLAGRAVFGLSAVSAAFIISSGYMTAIVANLLVGYLMDRFDKWKVLGSAIGLMIPAALMMTAHDLVLFRAGTALLIGLGFTATNQVYGVAGEILAGREAGNVMGVVSLGAGLCGYAGPQLLGALRDWSGGFDAGWYAAALMSAITLIEIVVLHRYRAAPAPAAVG